MKTLHDITQHLSSLDLLHCDEEQVRNLIAQIPSYALPILRVPKGSYFLRATSLDMNEGVTLKRLSYKQKNKISSNDTFQRATICGETIFYSVLLNSTQNNDVTDARALSLAEACRFFREEDVPDGIYRAAISEWRTTVDLNLCSIVSITGSNKSKCFQQIKQDCTYQMCEYYHQTDYDSQSNFQDFMAMQFRKPVEKGKEKEYMISAYYTHHLRTILADIIAGICYESAVNVDEKLNNTLCAAIFPEYVDSSKLLYSSKYLECKFERRNGIISQSYYAMKLLN